MAEGSHSSSESVSLSSEQETVATALPSPVSPSQKPGQPQPEPPPQPQPGAPPAAASSWLPVFVDSTAPPAPEAAPPAPAPPQTQQPQPPQAGVEPEAQPPGPQEPTVAAPPDVGPVPRGVTKAAGSRPPAPPSVDSSFEPGGGEAPAFQGMWYYVWTLVSLTFIALVIPLSIFLLPYTPVKVARKPSRLPWRTVVPDKHDGEYGEGVLESCDIKLVPDLTPAVQDSTIRMEFIPDTTTRQHRHMFCVFDTKYYRTSRPYLPKLVPYSYCSYILYYSVAFFEQGVYFKRPKLDHTYIRTFSDMRTSRKLKHGLDEPIPVIVTVGGDLVDGPNISRAVRSQLSRLTLATMLIQFVKLYDLQGINLDWDHPASDCGRQKDTDNIVEFFSFLGRRRNGRTLPLEFLFVLSVPPRLNDVQLYAINKYAKVLDHIVVLTHKLLKGRPVVGCTGRRQEATTVVRSLKHVLNYDAERKVCYSVSVGPDTFRAAEAKIGASSSGPAAIDPSTSHPGKAGYFEVCKLTDEVKTGDAECSLRFKLDQLTGEFLLAAHVTPENVRNRMIRSYDDGIGDYCIVVFDMDLDDYAGHCPLHDGRMSPITAAFISS